MIIIRFRRTDVYSFEDKVKAHIYEDLRIDFQRIRV